MNRLRKNTTPHQSRQTPIALAASREQGKSLYIWLIAGLILVLSGCGGSGSSSSSAAGSNAQVAGNWQFTLTSTQPTPPFSDNLQGGFLLQKDGSLTGQAVYSITLPSQSGTPTCDSGSANVTGTVSGQNVSLTAVGGSVTFTLTGTFSESSGASTISKGTYKATPATNSPCGTEADNGTWSATLVPPVTGGFQGFFHSTTSTNFPNQDFPVSGTLSQGPNVGASSASITGSLVFQDPASLLNDYPCLTTASVNGTISGNSVLLQIFSTNGLSVGQIGQTPGSGNPPTAVTFDSTEGGYVLHNLKGAVANSSGGGYLVTTKSCPGSPGDSGNLCLALGSGKACTQPITLTPFSLRFLPQFLGSAATMQTVTLTNTSGSALTGASLALNNNGSRQFYAGSIAGSDFNGAPSFTEQDTCTQQGTINLDPGSSCAITISFSPQESCPWLPAVNGSTSSSSGIDWLPPAKCPITLSAVLTVTIPSGGADADNEFAVPITGGGLSFVVPSVPEIDFGAEAVGEASPPQTLTLTNQSPNRVFILPSAEPCGFSNSFVGPALPRPPLNQSGQPLVNGIQLAETANVGLNNSEPIMADFNPTPPLVNAPTVQDFCDTDLPVSKGGTARPNFQIMPDGCSGQTLEPFGQTGDSCSLQVTFAPQPGTWLRLAEGTTIGLDDFLQLNTAWCGDANNTAGPNCEIDSGRFPVEIKTNPPSPLRMSPGAGMDFGMVLKGTAGGPLTITLFNDPVDPNSAPVNITSKIVSGDYLETDTCATSLAPNDSCTITITFIPKVVGLDPGTLTLTYDTGSLTGSVQTIFMRGMGQ